MHRTSVAEVLYEYAWQGAMGIDAEESDDESAQVAEFEALFEAENEVKEEDKTEYSDNSSDGDQYTYHQTEDAHNF